jgi:hypothetical protein
MPGGKSGLASTALNLPERQDAILLVLICTGHDHVKFPDSTDL